MQVLGNECLRPDTTLAQVRNVALRTPADGSISYQPGDLFGVYPGDASVSPLVTLLASTHDGLNLLSGLPE